MTWPTALALGLILGLLAACGGTPRHAEGPARPPTEAPPAPDAAALFAEALAAQQAGQPNAVARWQAAIVAAPGQGAPHVNLGVLYRQMGRLDDAIAEYRTAIRLDPESADAYHNLGLAYRAQGAWSEAERAYLDALALRPSQAETHYNLGVLYDLYLDKPESALTQYREVVVLGHPQAGVVTEWIRILERRVAAKPEREDVR
ncbi:MAG: tetratricopeptide repeat protein [Nitrospiria bacterium]